MPTPTIKVALVKASTPPFDVLFNKLAARLTGGDFCHCEIAFEGVSINGLRRLLNHYAARSRSEANNRARLALMSVCNLFPKDCPSGTNLTVAFYALQGMSLGVRVLAELADDPFYMQYDDGWRQYVIADAPQDVVTSQFVWCLEQTGKPYDTTGALTSVFRSAHHHSGLEPDRASWFCSNHCLRFCQHMALCGDLGLSGTTPNTLDKELHDIYIETSDGSVEDAPEVFHLNLNQSHWQVIADFVPYVIRSGKFSWDRTTLLENDQRET